MGNTQSCSVVSSETSDSNVIKLAEVQNNSELAVLKTEADLKDAQEQAAAAREAEADAQDNNAREAAERARIAAEENEAAARRDVEEAAEAAQEAADRLAAKAAEQAKQTEQDSKTEEKKENYYGGLIRGGVTGGGSSVVGGYSSLAEYGNSMFSKAKGELIRSIAKDVAGVLKISSSFAESADLKDVIAKFEKVVPDPRQGRKIKASKTMHIELCKKLANAINKSYKMELINVNDSAENICKSVSELLYSLFTGLHSEFITVAGDITTIMRNLNALQEYVDGINKKLIEDLQSCSPGSASLVKDSYDALSREIRRQHATLANLSTGVIGPVGSSLINILEETKSMPGLADDLRASTGTNEFSDKLSYMMKGTSSVAHAAYLVDKALKQIGMSTSEYKNTKNMKELRSKIYDIIVKDKPNSAQMHKMLVAADILYRNDLSHKDIVEHLNKKGGYPDKFYGEGDGYADMVSDTLYKNPDGVFKGRRFANQKSIGSELHKRNVYRERLLGTLNNEIQTCYNQIIVDLYKIAKKIGSEIAISDKLRMFIRQLGYFAGVQPNRKNIHKALSGFRRDVNSEYVKHDFLKALEAIKDAATELAASNGNYFKGIETSISRLIKVIDDFNDTFTKAITQVHVDVSRDSKSKGAESVGGDDSFVGDDSFGGDDSVGGDDSFGGDDSNFKYLVTMAKAIREIEYYFKIANIKYNLKIASSQRESYTKDYENILGEECGMLIDVINSKFKKLTCESNNFIDRNNIDYGDRQNCVVKQIIFPTGAPPAAAPNNQEEHWKVYVFMLEYIRSAKVEMIEAAQALDLYLSKFTEQIQMNPDDIKDFLKMLEQLEIVSKWFTDKSGDNLVNVFEAFPTVQDRAGGALPLDRPNKPLGRDVDPYTQHYYEEIAPTSSPGDWEKGVILDTMDNARDFIIRIEKSLKSMRALENIVAMFTKLSNKISGDEIKTFMSPGLMFKAFTKYTVATSIALGKYENHVLFENTRITTLPANRNILNYIGIPPDGGLGADNKILPAAGIANPAGGANIMPVNPFTSYIQWISAQPVDSARIRTAYLRPVKGRLYNNTYWDPLELGPEYLETDDIFEMCIKSMVSKVFTVVGAYSLYNRPSKDFKSNKSLSNSHLRQIMGGGASVKIIPEAIELYVRLTLLGEWYRELFKFSSVTPIPTNKQILVSMIPSFDGIWFDFVKIIFVDAENIDDGGYTQSFTEDIINSINTIYMHYKPKYGADICMKILENFVAEVNLRYGLVKQEEINSYINERNAGLNAEEYTTEDNVDYDILDSKDQFTRNAAPSDKFVSENYKMRSKTSVATKKLTEEIRKFRELVEANLNISMVATPGNFGNLALKFSSVDDLILQTTKRVKDADSDEKKYKIVQSTIIGVEKFSDVNYDVMLMFHETVINPLTILYTIYRMVNHFNRFANSMHLAAGAVQTPLNLMAALSQLKGEQTRYRNLTNPGGYSAKPYLYFSDIDYGRYFEINAPRVPTVPGPRGAASIATTFQPNDINLEHLMEDTLTHLFYLTCDKNPMVELHFSGDGNKRYPMLSFKNLEKYTIELLENVSESLGKFRKQLPYTVISKYENNRQDDFKMLNTDPQNPNVVSLFYLKEHLVDRLLKNKYGGGLSDANIALKKIWLYATRIDVGGGSPFHYGRLFARMIYWDASNFNGAGDNRYIFNTRTVQNNEWNKFPINFIGLTKQSSLVSERIAGDTQKILMKYPLTLRGLSNAPTEIYRGVADDISLGGFGFTNIYDYDAEINEYDAGAHQDIPKDQQHGILYDLSGPIAAAPVSLFSRFYSEYGISSSYGLLFKLNRMIYHYVNMFTDKTSGKIYLPLLEKFSNGVNAREIMKGYSIDDITPFSFTENDLIPDHMAKKAILNSMLNPGAIYAGYQAGLAIVPPPAGFVANLTHPAAADVVVANMLANPGGVVDIAVTGFINANANPDVDNNPIVFNLTYAEYYKAVRYRYNLMQTNPGINFENGYKRCAEMYITDCVKTNPAAFPMCEIDPRSVLFATLARAIRNIVTDKKNMSTVTVLTLAEPNLLAVSDYMKDLMTAYLPIFEKQINILCAKADLFKTVIENTKISVIKPLGFGTPRPPVAAVAMGPVLAARGVINPNQVEIDGIALPLLAVGAAGDESKCKNFFLTMLTSIISTARSLQGCIKGVYKELADVPLYFETYQNSITDYKNRNGTMPLMPLSHVSHLLNNHHRLIPGQDYRPRMELDMPEYSGGRNGGVKVGGAGDRLMYYIVKGLIPHKDVGVGSDEFKFAYGTRGLLSDNNEPNIEYAPGVLNMLDTYNNKVGGATSIDKRKLTESFVNQTHLLRFATDYIYHKTYIGDNNLDKLTDFFIVTTRDIVENPAVVVRNRNVLQHLSCQTGRHVRNNNSLNNFAAVGNQPGIISTNDSFFIKSSNITLLIENDNFKQALYRMLNCIVTNGTPSYVHENERKKLRIYNILDSNIVPINFHALQREIPLVNIFNYSYTFDQMIKEFIGVDTKDRTISNIVINDSREWTQLSILTYLGYSNVPVADAAPVAAIAGAVINAVNLSAGAGNTAGAVAGAAAVGAPGPPNADALYDNLVAIANAAAALRGATGNSVALAVENAGRIYTLAPASIAVAAQHAISIDGVVPGKAVSSLNAAAMLGLPVPAPIGPQQHSFPTQFPNSYLSHQICFDDNNQPLMAGGNRVPKITEYPEDALVRFLLQPRGPRFIVDYINSVFKLSSGNDSLSLNRPKYLSDQLWNKVLLNSLYNHDNFNPGAVAAANPNGNVNIRNRLFNASRTMQNNEPYLNFSPNDSLNSNDVVFMLMNHEYSGLTYLRTYNAPGSNTTDRHKLTVNQVVGLVEPPGPRVIGIPRSPGITPVRNNISTWHTVGYNRYHTTLVRYIEFFVHTQRIMRHLMRKELTWVNDPIVHRSNALHEQVTDYDGNRGYENEDYE